MENPEKLTTYGTPDEDKQNKNTTKSYVFDNDIHTYIVINLSAIFQCFVLSYYVSLRSELGVVMSVTIFS
jgi:hypothetical protein